MVYFCHLTKIHTQIEIISQFYVQLNDFAMSITLKKAIFSGAMLTPNRSLEKRANVPQGPFINYDLGVCKLEARMCQIFLLSPYIARIIDTFCLCYYFLCVLYTLAYVWGNDPVISCLHIDFFMECRPHIHQPIQNVGTFVEQISDFTDMQQLNSLELHHGYHKATY